MGETGWMDKESVDHRARGKKVSQEPCLSLSLSLSFCLRIARETGRDLHSRSRIVNESSSLKKGFLERKFSSSRGTSLGIDTR